MQIFIKTLTVRPRNIGSPVSLPLHSACAISCFSSPSVCAHSLSSLFISALPPASQPSCLSLSPSCLRPPPHTPPPSPQGKTVTIDASSGDTILLIKSKFQDKEGVDPAHQCLLFDANKLEDGKTLADYDIQKECTLTMVDIMDGGGESKGEGGAGVAADHVATFEALAGDPKGFVRDLAMLARDIRVEAPLSWTAEVAAAYDGALAAYKAAGRGADLDAETERMLASVAEDMVAEIFKEFDADGNGSIDAGELQDGVRAGGDDVRGSRGSGHRRARQGRERDDRDRRVSGVA